MAALSRDFAARRVHKEYTAIVAGVVQQDRLEIDLPIGRDPERRPQWNWDEQGKKAVSRLRVLKRAEMQTLVALEPITGRTNQLRIHCAYAGHPICGDETYGGPPASRLYLHASQLEFVHPATGERLQFESPAPGFEQAIG
jgi:23S rRNA-/tRNA-specific pseudouridylate synthase